MASYQYRIAANIEHGGLGSHAFPHVNYLNFESRTEQALPSSIWLSSLLVVLAIHLISKVVD
jgi:hypothetical protein